MPNPQILAIPAGQWTLAASNVSTGTIRILNTAPHAYFQTYRDTGGAAPTDKSEAVPLCDGDLISGSVPLDVYIWAEAEDGSVRVDL